MKKIILTSLIVLFAVITQAASIKSEKLLVSPSEIHQVIRLVDKNQPGSSQKKLNIVLTDNGHSTDVSPRYQIYLGYASLAEMGNIFVDFKISDQALQFVSAERISAGIYEVKTVEYRDEGMFNVTHKIDATKMFSDEKKFRDSCVSDFCDGTLETTVDVTETATLQTIED